MSKERREKLAQCIADRAQLGEVHFGQPLPFFDEDFPKDLSVARLEAQYGSRSKFTVSIPVTSSMISDSYFRGLVEERCKLMIRQSLYKHLAQNLNVVGPKNKLP